MISDVLSDAICEIERYQQDFPDSYNSLREEIEQVKAVMKRLMIKLDTPPDYQDRECINRS